MDKRIKISCRRIRNADKIAASELLEIYYADIYSYLRRLCSNREDAEDLTQQTFLKVWSSINSFACRSKFSSWLYRIAYNTFVDWRSKNSGSAKVRPEQWWQECKDTNIGPFTNAAERQLAQLLYDAVDQFDEGKKHVTHLHYYQGLSIKQTAKVLDISTSTVKYRLREVLKILKVKLGVRKEEFKQKQKTPITKGELL